MADVADKDKCSMNDWYNDLINKTYNQLDLFDVTRMIIQKIFLEVAIPKAISFLENNPFCGQRYEGELMELLSKLDLNCFDKYTDDIQQILSKALIENKTYAWLCEEERNEFSEVIKFFQMRLREA